MNKQATTTRRGSGFLPGTDISTGRPINPIAPRVREAFPDIYQRYYQTNVVPRLHPNMVNTAVRTGLTYYNTDPDQAVRRIQQDLAEIASSAGRLVSLDAMGEISLHIVDYQLALTKLLTEAAIQPRGDVIQTSRKLRHVFKVVQAGPTKYDFAAERAQNFGELFKNPKQYAIGKMHEAKSGKRLTRMDKFFAGMAKVNPEEYRRTVALQRFFRNNLFRRIAKLTEPTVVALDRFESRYTQLKTKTGKASATLHAFAQHPRTEKLQALAVGAHEEIQNLRAQTAEQLQNLREVAKHPLEVGVESEAEIWDVARRLAQQNEILRSAKVTLQTTVNALLAATATHATGQAAMTRETRILGEASVQASSVVLVGLHFVELTEAALIYTVEGKDAAHSFMEQSPLLQVPI